MRIWIYMVICVLCWHHVLIAFIGVCLIEVLGKLTGVFKDSC